MLNSFLSHAFFHESFVLTVYYTLFQLLYSGEGENFGTCRGVVELLELVVILLF